MDAIELHFVKTDNAPWGFRLTGGVDYDQPLTVVKVSLDSPQTLTHPRTESETINNGLKQIKSDENS